MVIAVGSSGYRSGDSKVCTEGLSGVSAPSFGTRMMCMVRKRLSLTNK